MVYLQPVALIGVRCAALYLIGLGILTFFWPDRARSFLLNFASSIRLHYLEVSIRIVTGTCFILASPSLAWSFVSALFGWVLVSTSGALLLVPWQWHQRFAKSAVPFALRHLKLVGVCSLSAGIWAAAGVFLGATT